MKTTTETEVREIKALVKILESSEDNPVTVTNFELEDATVISVYSRTKVILRKFPNKFFTQNDKETFFIVKDIEKSNFEGLNLEALFRLNNPKKAPETRKSLYENTSSRGYSCMSKDGLKSLLTELGNIPIVCISTNLERVQTELDSPKENIIKLPVESLKTILELNLVKDKVSIEDFYSYCRVRSENPDYLDYFFIKDGFYA